MIKFRILFYVLIFPAILSAQYLTPQFGGEYREVSETSDCLSDEQRAQYLKECFESIEELKARGIIKEAKNRRTSRFFYLARCCISRKFRFCSLWYFRIHRSRPGIPKSSARL